MNKIIILLCLVLGLSGCTNEVKPEVKEDPHCSFYSENYSVEDVIKYFDEVVLDSEYSSGEGDCTLVQKWIGPIYFVMEGHSEQDRLVLEKLFSELNKVEGFPGIYKAEGLVSAKIHFYNEKDFYKEMGHIVSMNADGAVQYWYDTDMNYIYEGKVAYRNNMDDDVRESVLKEEIINMLGITDTTLREDSITYQYSSTNKDLSEMDWIILKILYHDEIKASMDATKCHEIIKKLYY